jgi:hypothetical protein
MPRHLQSLPDGGISRCVATVRTGTQLKSKADMEKAVREFVMTVEQPIQISGAIDASGQQLA